MTQTSSDIFRILTVAPNLIQIEVLDSEKFVQQSQDFTIGSYLKISDESNTCIIALVQSYKIKETNTGASTSEQTPLSFILDAQPIGFLDSNGKFKRGGQQIAIPPNNVEIADTSLLNQIYASVEEKKKFIFSTLAQNTSIDIAVDGDKFFSKHIAVVGSTGSGKSGTVAKILQEGMAATEEQNKKGFLNNTHILLFDLHGEYGPAFLKAKKIDVSNLVLPYWLMNSEELEEMFIESRESNSHNQISQFKTAVTLNKKRHNSALPKVNYDTPVYFSIDEVYNYINNLNNLTTYLKGSDMYFASLTTNEIFDKEKLWVPIEFEESTGNSKHDTLGSKVSKSGGFTGEFDRFIPRLETKLH